MIILCRRKKINIRVIRGFGSFMHSVLIVLLNALNLSPFVFTFKKTGAIMALSL